MWRKGKYEELIGSDHTLTTRFICRPSYQSEKKKKKSFGGSFISHSNVSQTKKEKQIKIEIEIQ
jgi:K+-transporting ATPase c subunit